MGVRAWLFLVSILALAGCAVSGPAPSGTPSFYGTPTRLKPASGSAAVPGETGPIALLVPLSGPNAARGAAMRQAAELALGGSGAGLDVRDTGGTPAGAAAAAGQAIGAGARIVLGPLTAAETGAVAPVARRAGVPVLAFTSDPAQARPGVWTLGLTPAEQVRRLVVAARSDGRSRFAALLPANEFGRAMREALLAAAASSGAPAPVVRLHEPGMRAMTPVVKELADYAGRRGPLDAKLRAARARHDAEGRQEARDLARASVPPPPFDALLLADTGEELDELSALLAYYDVAAPQVRFLGPALWADPATRAAATRALAGAWYAAPDPDYRAGFVDAYQEKFGATPPGLADLAFDAAAIARVLAQEGRFSTDSLTRSNGFAGADGPLALTADGHVHRGLAIFEIKRGGSGLVDKAPRTLAAPGT